MRGDARYNAVKKALEDTVATAEAYKLIKVDIFLAMFDVAMEDYDRRKEAEAQKSHDEFEAVSKRLMEDLRG